LFLAIEAVLAFLTLSTFPRRAYIPNQSRPFFPNAPTSIPLTAYVLAASPSTNIRVH